MPAGNEELIFAVFITASTFLLLALVVVMLVYNYFKVKNRRQQDILSAIFKTQEAERDRISEELHDGIGGKLSVLKLQNEILLSENESEQTSKYVAGNSRLIDSIVTDIRRMVRNQSSKYILSNGLSNEMEALIRLYTNVSAGLTIDFRSDFSTDSLIPDFQVALFRILQELLHNSVKHSGATKIEIYVTVSQSDFQVTYRDNGRGFESAGNDDGMGMRNIRARSELYQGSIRSNTSSGNGVHFDFHFPFSAIFAKKEEED